MKIRHVRGDWKLYRSEYSQFLATPAPTPNSGATCSRIYRGADKSLARPTSRIILFDGENISFYASLVIYI
jgi:hypothetical protein